MAKNLINKYVWLVETIYKAGRITFEEINQKWVDKFEEDPIPLRTFHKWRIAAEDMFNLAIECERKRGYHYYIENADEIKRGGLRNWLMNTISVSNLLLDSQSIKDRILLEDIPSGQNELAVIIDATAHHIPKLLEGRKSHLQRPSLLSEALQAALVHDCPKPILRQDNDICPRPHLPHLEAGRSDFQDARGFRPRDVLL